MYKLKTPFGCCTFLKGNLYKDLYLLLGTKDPFGCCTFLKCYLYKDLYLLLGTAWGKTGLVHARLWQAAGIFHFSAGTISYVTLSGIPDSGQFDANYTVAHLTARVHDSFLPKVFWISLYYSAHLYIILRIFTLFCISLHYSAYLYIILCIFTLFCISLHSAILHILILFCIYCIYVILHIFKFFCISSFYFAYFNTIMHIFTLCCLHWY